MKKLDGRISILSYRLLHTMVLDVVQYSVCAYAMHILNNRHEYGPETETLQLMKHCTKGSKMSCWENMYIQIHYIRGVLISEQQVSKLNPLYTVANLTRLMPGITLVANEGHGEDGQHHIQNHRIQ